MIYFTISLDIQDELKTENAVTRLNEEVQMEQIK